MFTQGQLIFAAFFIIVFSTIIFYSYKKDKALHQKYYKGAFWVLIALVLFVAFLYSIKLLRS